VVETLSRDFIPAAANTAHLAPEEKKGRNWCDTSRFIEKIIERSGLRKQDESQTAQGYYAFSAAGDYYGSINTHDPDELLTILERARKEFAAKPPAKVPLQETSIGPESAVPAGALVLRVFSRILPLPEGLSALQRRRNGQLGRDHLWLLQEDAQAILSTLRDAEEADAPDAISKRLCRFHLTDNVRGESDLWETEQLQKRSFKVARMAQTETLLTVKLTGSYAMRMSGIRVEGRDKKSDMGLEGVLEGILQIDRTRRVFKDAKIHASATGWGASTFTPDEPPGRFPIQFAMVVASDEVSKQVAPQGVLHSGRDEYIAP
jgi:hypothetical protein